MQKNFKRHLAAFEKAYPRLQLMKLVSERIQSLVNLASSELGSELSLKELEYIEKLASQLKHISLGKAVYSSDIHTVINFRIVSDLFEGLVVPGTNEARLAVQEGREVTVSLQGIAGLPEFTIADVVQLLMHETGHLIEDVDLEFKDRVAGKLASKVRELTQSLDLKNGRRLHFVFTKIPWSMLERQWTRSYSNPSLELWSDYLNNNIFSVIESEVASREFGQFKEALLNMPLPNGHQRGVYIPMPQIHNFLLRLTPDSKIKASIQTETVFADLSERGDLRQVSPSLQAKIALNMGKVPLSEKYLLTVSADPKKTDFEIQNDFRVDQGLANFSVHKITRLNSRLFVSLIVDRANFSLNDLAMAQLVTKDAQNAESMRVPVLKYRFLESGQVILHFELKEGQPQLAYLSVMHKISEVQTRELQIRPSQNYVFSVGLSPSRIDLAKPEVLVQQNPAKPHENKLIIKASSEELRRLDVISATVEIAAVVILQTWDKPPTVFAGTRPTYNHNEVANLTYKQIYRVPVKRMNSQWSLELPFQSFNKVMPADEVLRIKIGWVGDIPIQGRVQPIRDTSYRTLKRLILHTRSGRSIQVNLTDSSLAYPIVDVEKERKRIDELVKRRLEYYDLDTPKTEPLTCEKVLL